MVEAGGVVQEGKEREGEAEEGGEGDDEESRERGMLGCAGILTSMSASASYT